MTGLRRVLGTARGWRLPAGCQHNARPSTTPFLLHARGFSKEGADARRERMLAGFEAEKRQQLGLDVVTTREEFVFPQLRAVRRLDSRAIRRRLQAEGRLPGVLYGPGGKKGTLMGRRVLLSTDQKEILAAARKFGAGFENTVFELTLEGDFQRDGSPDTTHYVTPRDLNRHVVTDEPYCVNFLRFSAKRAYAVPLEVIGEDSCMPLRLGGWLNLWKREVLCRVDEDWRLPRTLRVDLAGLGPKEHIRLDRIQFPEGVRPAEGLLVDGTVDPLFGVGNVQGKGSAAAAAGGGGAVVWDEDEDEDDE